MPFNILIVNFSFKMTMNLVQITDNYLNIAQAKSILVTNLFKWLMMSNYNVQQGVIKQILGMCKVWFYIIMSEI